MNTRGVPAVLAAAAVTAHALPGALAISPVRAVLAPRLAGVGAPGRVALTFDDGPDPASTPAFLDLLAARGTTATFFLLGSMVARSPGLARRIVDEGHEVAVHGYRHRPLLLRTPKSTLDDIRRAYDLIGSVTGTIPRWYRPPYGVFSTASLLAARQLRLRPVLWTAWGRDWTASANAESVTRTVHKGLRSGGTVLLHDSDCTAAPGCWRSTLAALPGLLDHWSEVGWRVGPLGAHTRRR
jgi:peptidoglycan/xylan/chitin deacetylase (PgdA/CDA1 family)